MATKKPSTVVPIKKAGQQPIARNKLEAYGITAVCADMVNGMSMTAIAKSKGVDVSSLTTWIELDEQRSALARSARIQAARTWDELAETVLKDAADPFELAKARELASHYRWRAKAVAPRDYGDKVTTELTGSNGGPIQIAAMNLKNISDAELNQMQELLNRSGEDK